METKKYIIEIPDNTAWLQWVKVSDKDGHVCFDFKDPEDLTPYEERAIGNCPDVAVCTQEAYQKGLNDAWEAARKIACDRVHGGFNIDTKLHIFGEADYAYILANYNAPEAVDKIQQYEQEQENFKVGYEVINDEDVRGTIVDMDDYLLHVLDENGVVQAWPREDAVKTGRYFPEIAEVLRKMQEEKE